jgi:mRNA-degrading endonuclease RelE of RelBE toxin-antitoxin system
VRKRKIQHAKKTGKLSSKRVKAIVKKVKELKADPWYAIRAQLDEYAREYLSREHHNWNIESENLRNHIRDFSYESGVLRQEMENIRSLINSHAIGVQNVYDCFIKFLAKFPKESDDKFLDKIKKIKEIIES